MARKLSAKQIAILKNHSDCTDFLDLPLDVQEELEQYNDYDLMVRDASRFLADQFYSMRNVDGSLKHKFIIH